MNDTGQTPTGQGRKRLRVLSLYYAPELTGNAPLVTTLTRMLAAKDFEVEVVAGTPYYHLPAVPERYRRRLYVRETLDGVRVVRCYAYTGSRGLISRLLNYLTFILTALPVCLFGRRADALLVTSPPFLLGVLGAGVRWVRGTRLIYNAQDLFPEAYVRAGLVRQPWLVGLLARVQRWVYRRADAVTVITPGFRDHLVAQDVPAEKIHVIPNFADTERIRPLPRKNPFSAEHRLDARFVVLCAGNIGYLHGMEILVPVAKQLEGEGDIQVLVVGDGSERQRVVQASQAAGVSNMGFLLPQPDEVLPWMLAAADVGVVTTRPGVAHSSFPSRIYSLMAAARPVVAAVDEDSDAAVLLRTAGCGLVVAPSQPEELARAILALRADPARRQRMGEAGRRHILEHYTKERVVARYIELLEQLRIGAKADGQG